jgi:hypothetical protein
MMPLEELAAHNHKKARAQIDATRTLSHAENVGATKLSRYLRAAVARLAERILGGRRKIAWRRVVQAAACLAKQQFSA